MITATGQNRDRRFQPEPVEISARLTIEGKRYRARQSHVPIHKALVLNAQRQNSVGHMELEEHGTQLERSLQMVSRRAYSSLVTGRRNSSPLHLIPSRHKYNKLSW